MQDVTLPESSPHGSQQLETDVPLLSGRQEDVSVTAAIEAKQAVRASQLKGILAGLAAGAMWGLVFVAPRMTAEFSPVDLTAARYVTYGVLAFVALLIRYARGAQLPTAVHLQAAAGLSVLGFLGYYLLLVLSIRYVGVELPSLIIGTIPIWLMVLGKPQELQWRALFPGLVLTAAGLILMTEIPDVSSSSFKSFWTGILFATIALASWTMFAALNAQWLRKHPEISDADWSSWLGIATGTGGFLVWLLWGTELHQLISHPKFTQFAIISLAMGIGASWLGILLWNYASRTLSTSLCGQLIVSETLFALIYSFLWSGEWPTSMQYTAAILFTLGIFASIRAHR